MATDLPGCTAETFAIDTQTETRHSCLETYHSSTHEARPVGDGLPGTVWCVQFERVGQLHGVEQWAVIEH
jgi:hypothetical protein